MLIPIQQKLRNLVVNGLLLLLKSYVKAMSITCCMVFT